MIYEDGYIIRFSSGETALFSLFNPLLPGPVSSETIYTVKDDDSLFSLAESHYRTSAYWYILAEWNNLGDPLSLITGTILKIPKFD